MWLLLFSCPVTFNSLWPHGLQHTRPPCPSPSPRVCPNSYSLHQWCHPAISSSDTLFSFCPQSFPASGTFPMSQLFVSDDQNTGVGKESPCNVGDLCSTPGLGRSCGGGNGNPLQYSCLENPHGQRSLWDYSLWDRKESDTTEQLSTCWWFIQLQHQSFQWVFRVDLS